MSIFIVTTSINKSKVAEHAYLKASFAVSKNLLRVAKQSIWKSQNPSHVS